MKNKNNAKIKVLVAMSGGVDSSVAAALLVSQGYNVTGVFVVNYEEENEEMVKCWTSDYQDALRVAAHLGIPLVRWDFKKEYKAAVLDYMYDQYRAGRTPNPDVLCNKFVKFGAWLDKARQFGFDKLATGHYARVGAKADQYTLLQAKDDNKDQTYFLHQLNQDQLARTLFPLGNYTKPQVRKLAKKFGLPTAEKEESMGICFVGEVPMKEFLAKEIKSKKGNIILSSGEVLEQHDGIQFYTIGKRSLAVKTNANKPLFVVDKRVDANELVVGYEDDPLLYKKESEISGMHWVCGAEPKLPLSCKIRLRHRQPLQNATVNKKDGKIIAQFSKLQRAVTPGQFAVIYKNGQCLGGGVIA